MWVIVSGPYRMVTPDTRGVCALSNTPPPFRDRSMERGSRLSA